MADVPEFFKPRVSDTAKASVAKRFPHLPLDAAEIAAGYLTLIEEVDAKHKQSADPDISYAAALEMSRAFEHQPPWKQERLRREWMEEREHFIRPLAAFLALYPAPIFMILNDKKAPPVPV